LITVPKTTEYRHWWSANTKEKQIKIYKVYPSPLLNKPYLSFDVLQEVYFGLGVWLLVNHAPIDSLN
jgi:hypothetical protein